jgi:3-dehydroquinate synthase
MTQSSATVQVELGDRSYRIDIGESLWSHLAASVAEELCPTRLAVITDTHVGPLYNSKLSKAFEGRPWKTTFHQMTAGEQHKNLATVEQLYTEVLDAGCDRKTPILALGGGVPGDTAGFVAATLLRGLPFVQVPTTLLAMVDSSVGGKTGVDMPHGKNLIGAFHQPSLVVISLDTLKTLPRREFSAGLAEVIKYGVIWDRALFESLERDVEGLLAGDSGQLARVIQRCCEIKAEVVSKDERESGLREILNFGHTAGHALEAATAYGELLHGEAISIGMLVETALAELRGAQLGDLRGRLGRLLYRAGLPISWSASDLDRIWDLMHADKKARAGKIRMVLPTDLGQVESVSGISREEFEQAWRTCCG